MSDQLSNLILARTRLTGIESDDLADSIREQFLVIPRTDLPKAIESEDEQGRRVLKARGATLDGDGWAAGSDALGWLAIKEYLDAHPPVDEAQVRALTELIDDTHQSWDSKRIATYLARHGVTVKEQK